MMNESPIPVAALDQFQIPLDSNFNPVNSESIDKQQQNQHDDASRPEKEPAGEIRGETGREIVAVDQAKDVGSVVLAGKSPLLAAAMQKYATPRSSSYHGVTRLKWSGKFEAHLWDNLSQVEGRKRKGKHVYLGSYETEEKAARAHDLAALKFWGAGSNTKLNFPVTEYEKDMEIMTTMSQEEYVAYVRRKCSCFSRGASRFRGVTRRKDGKFQARIGRVGESRETKDIYLGTFETEEEAAEAYDIAAIELRGRNAVTNFGISNYFENSSVKLLEPPSATSFRLEGS
ncbi:hypothetical protein LUZ60_003078 [Juncus effusus]|nr:hypothetical protein LUZ60_003078 [Juncus effusus]